MEADACCARSIASTASAVHGLFAKVTSRVDIRRIWDTFVGINVGGAPLPCLDAALELGFGAANFFALSHAAADAKAVDSDFSADEVGRAAASAASEAACLPPKLSVGWVALDGVGDGAGFDIKFSIGEVPTAVRRRT